jgi:nucleotidyltransferase substrate binding protein (TIGR01987 family)
MERIEKKYLDIDKALKTLEDILKEKYSIIVRDASIQRFEYTFEAFWKYIQEYLKETEGIISNSPKSCFRELFSLGLISEELAIKCLEMTDSRNHTSHTYKEEVSQIIYGKLKQYVELIGTVLPVIKPKFNFQL